MIFFDTEIGVLTGQSYIATAQTLDFADKDKLQKIVCGPSASFYLRCHREFKLEKNVNRSTDIYKIGTLYGIPVFLSKENHNCGKVAHDGTTIDKILMEDLNNVLLLIYEDKIESLILYNIRELM